MSFPHPDTGNSMTVYAPLPHGLMSLLRELAKAHFPEILKSLPELEFMCEIPAGDSFPAA